MKEKTKIPVQFILGLILALAAGASMFFGTFSIAIRLLIGFVGLYLIATSKYRLL